MKRDTIKQCHPNAPNKLVSLFIQYDKKYHRLAQEIKVNVRYVYELLHYGKEPTKKTLKGRKARERMFLDNQPKKKPDFIVAWDHLPKEERHKVIQEYLKWKHKS